MGILRADRVSGLGGANAINGSVFFGRNGTSASASGNWLTMQSDSDFNFGDGDFTIEYWFYFTGVSGSNHGCFQISNTPGGINNANNATAGGLALNYENGCVKGIGNNGWFNGTNSVAVETWNHVALVRHSGTLQIFTNGVADTSASDSNHYALTHLAIGGYYSTSHLFSGYISNFRIVKGTALYSAAFTPPTERLTAVDGTVVLACQSPGNVLQEAKGNDLVIRRVNVGDAPPAASRFVPNKGEENGTIFADNTKFDTLSYMVPPGGKTIERYVKSTGDIVSGNLIWHIDAGNTTSYAGVTTSGTTIYDLKAGSGMNGNVGIATLASGHASWPAPGWTSDNGGAWYLGSDSTTASNYTGQKIDMPYINLGNDNYTINAWVKLKHYSENSDGYSYIISNKDSSPVSFHAHVKEVSGKGRIGAGAYYGGWNYDYAKDVDYNTVIALNQWYMLTWVNTAQYTQSMYVNGVIQKLHNANANTWNSRTSNNTPLNATSYANNETTNAWIGQIQYYSDTLSKDEILQNYNAHKCRYDQ